MPPQLSALPPLQLPGTFPTALAFDGANLWVANTGSNNVTKLQAFDGVNQGTFNVGGNPGGVAFDGTNA